MTTLNGYSHINNNQELPANGIAAIDEASSKLKEAADIKNIEVSASSNDKSNGKRSLALENGLSKKVLPER